MLTISAACARCGHAKSIHTLVYADQPDQIAGRVRREGALRCTHCGKHSIAILDAIAIVPLDPQHCQLWGDIAQFESTVRLIEIIPPILANIAPNHVPEAVARAYIDGQDMLDAKKWTLAAGSFRTTMDRATKVLWGPLGDGTNHPSNLAARIEALANRIGIPQSIIEWAHNVRGVGNEIHEMEEVDQLDAFDSGKFTEMFLTYTFTLPKEVEEFRARRAP
jgi:hypothetical protein